MLDRLDPDRALLQQDYKGRCNLTYVFDLYGHRMVGGRRGIARKFSAISRQRKNLTRPGDGFGVGALPGPRQDGIEVDPRVERLVAAAPERRRSRPGLRSAGHAMNFTCPARCGIIYGPAPSRVRHLGRSFEGSCGCRGADDPRDHQRRGTLSGADASSPELRSCFVGLEPVYSSAQRLQASVRSSSAATRTRQVFPLAVFCFRRNRGCRDDLGPCPDFGDPRRPRGDPGAGRRRRRGSTTTAMARPTSTWRGANRGLRARCHGSCKLVHRISPLVSLS